MAAIFETRTLGRSGVRVTTFGFGGGPVGHLESDTGEKHADLDDGKNLRDDLGLDSVDVVSIVSQIERRFRIRLTHQELEKLVTVGDVLTRLIETTVGASLSIV